MSLRVLLFQIYISDGDRLIFVLVYICTAIFPYEYLKSRKY